MKLEVLALVVTCCCAIGTTKRPSRSAVPSAMRAVDDLARRKCTQRRWIDPWGMSYAVYCGHGINIAQSFGPDRIPNTSDDIWSNR